MLGYCWGAKLVLLAGSHDVYSAVAVAHPSYVTFFQLFDYSLTNSCIGGYSLLTPEDAANLKAPLALYPTPNEDAATVRSLYPHSLPQRQFLIGTVSI